MNEIIIAVCVLVCIAVYLAFRMNKHTRENIKRWCIQLRMDSKAGAFDAYYGMSAIIAIVFGIGSLVVWAISLW